MPTSTIYLFQTNTCFELDLKRVFAERYMKLQYYVNLSVVTLQGSVYTHARVKWIV